MKNIIEKRKSQLNFIGAIILAISVIIAVIGVVLFANSGIGENLNILKLVVGIVLFVLGFIGIFVGIYLSWIARAVQATKGSIAEDNLGHGTVNMHKCSNCGAQIEEGKSICSKCEEDLKP